jgi:phage shock protein A
MRPTALLAAPMSASDRPTCGAVCRARASALYLGKVTESMNADSPDAHQREVKAALESLHRELAGLEAEIAGVEGRLSDIRARQRMIEQRAMDAIRAGDDRAARAALIEMLPHAEDAAPLEADLTVLRAMADECRRWLATA